MKTLGGLLSSTVNILHRTGFPHSDAPNHVPGRMFRDELFEALNGEDLNARDWVIECVMVK